MRFTLFLLVLLLPHLAFAQPNGLWEARGDTSTTYIQIEDRSIWMLRVFDNGDCFGVPAMVKWDGPVATYPKGTTIRFEVEGDTMAVSGDAWKRTYHRSSNTPFKRCSTNERSI